MYSPLSLLLLSTCWQLGDAVDSTCKLTSILFRHGDRSPMGPVPSDLHTESAWPQGYAQLTTVGMRQAYELGQFLRSWYDGFLSKRYIRHEVYVESTDTERTLMSAQAVLSSLYVPHGVQAWQPGILWQPVPIHPSTWAKLDRYCTNDIIRVTKENILQEYRHKYKEAFEEIEKGLGTKLQSLGMLWTIYDTFKCEHEHNLTWPSWMDEPLLDTMREILPYRHLAIYSLSPDRADLLYKMISDMIEYIRGTADTDRKALVYSGHDTNILCLLCAMGVYNLQMTPYSAAIMIELHYGNWTNETHEDKEPYDNGDDGQWPQSVSGDNRKRVHRSENLFNLNPESNNGTVYLNETTSLPTPSTSSSSFTTSATTNAEDSTSTEHPSVEFNHNRTSQPRWFVQIWLRNETHNSPYKLTVPGCTADCPWERFVELTLPAVNDLHQNLSYCSKGRKKMMHYHKLWRVMFVAVGAGGVVMLAVVVFSAICLYQHRKRRQRLQAIYRQLNTEDIPMSDTS